MPHYFDPDPAAPSRPTTVELVLPDGKVELRADRGVFSAGSVDAGTFELLKATAALPAEPPAGDLADVGCGYGPIAVTLARRHPDRTVWALDVNRRALELTMANADRLGLANLRAVTPDRVPAELTFAQVWSNPPIRIGKAALHDLLATWLGRLDRSAPGAEAWLVVHKNLGSDSLADWLGTTGYRVQRTGSRKGYRLLRVEPA